jgi:hypothetical protein
MMKIMLLACIAVVKAQKAATGPAIPLACTRCAFPPVPRARRRRVGSGETVLRVSLYKSADQGTIVNSCTKDRTRVFKTSV